MKIYSSDANRNLLDQFVGQDIWVKVDLDFGGEVYVRLIKKTSEGYWYNGYLNSDSSDDIDEILYGELTCTFDEIELVKPINILTTTELIDLIKSDSI